jgi:hypothetical protein
MLLDWQYCNYLTNSMEQRPSDPIIANKTIYFMSLPIMLTILQLRLNWTGDLWWWKWQIEITKICISPNNASLLI